MLVLVCPWRWWDRSLTSSLLSLRWAPQIECKRPTDHSAFISDALEDLRLFYAIPNSPEKNFSILDCQVLVLTSHTQRWSEFFAHRTVPHLAHENTPLLLMSNKSGKAFWLQQRRVITTSEFPTKHFTAILFFPPNLLSQLSACKTDCP